MIQTHEQLRIADENKEFDLTFEVNWNPKDQKSNNCQLIRVLLPDGKVSVIKREHLNAVLFAIGTEEDQRDLVPQHITTIRNYETVLGITATKNIAKGEKINVSVKIPIPVANQEVVTKFGGSKGIKSQFKI